jgi:hypothetical protein
MRSTVFFLVLSLVAPALPASAAVRHHHHHTAAHHSTAHRRATHLRVSRRQAAVENAALTTESNPISAEIPAYRLTASGAFPPMKGTLASLERQDQRTEADGLTRIQNDAELNQLRLDRKLVSLPVGAGLRVNPEMPVNRRYCRPWTARFLSDLARAHSARFHNALQVNSAVRTVAFQRHLLEVNGNAAPASGDTASPHLTGATIDIGKRELSFSEIAWMRAWLMPLQAAGKIDVEEEFYQACFHITVYKSYTPDTAPQHIPVHRRHASATLLAAGVH